jgi:hypothetical protein
MASSGIIVRKKEPKFIINSDNPLGANLSQRAVLLSDKRGTSFAV